MKLSISSLNHSKGENQIFGEAGPSASLIGAWKKKYKNAWTEMKEKQRYRCRLHRTCLLLKLSPTEWCPFLCLSCANDGIRQNKGRGWNNKYFGFTSLLASLTFFIFNLSHRVRRLFLRILYPIYRARTSVTAETAIPFKIYLFFHPPC